MTFTTVLNLIEAALTGYEDGLRGIETHNYADHYQQEANVMGYVKGQRARTEIRAAIEHREREASA